MSTYQISATEYQCLQYCIEDLSLTSADFIRDGHGGFDIEYNPVLPETTDKYLLDEIISQLIDDLNIYWNVHLEFTSACGGQLEITYVETRNVSEYEDEFIEQLNFMSPELNKHIEETYAVDFESCEKILFSSMEGSSAGDFNVASFSMVVFVEEDEIEISDETTIALAGVLLHQNALLFGPQDEPFDYEFSSEEQFAELNIMLSQKSIQLIKAD